MVVRIQTKSEPLMLQFMKCVGGRSEVDALVLL